MVEPFLEHVSYVGIAVAIMLTGMGLPVPEEVFVIVAGVASSEGALSPWPALAACLVGAMVGDCAMYAIGYHFGHGLLRDHRWFARFLKPDRERHVEHMIQKHGLKVFLVSRFLVGLRTPVYVTAGILRVPFRQFIIADAFSAIAVVSTFFGLAYVFAEQIYEIWGRIRQAEIALTILSIAGVAAFLLYFYFRGRRRWARLARLRRIRKAREQGSSTEPAEQGSPIV